MAENVGPVFTGITQMIWIMSHVENPKMTNSRFVGKEKWLAIVVPV